MTDSNYLVSIIIPTYNCAKYIKESVDSCINQTYKNIEIIVIDDGSTDNTKEILQEYIDSNKIKYIYQKNSERSVARNNGLDNANGEYIQFLDSDDILKKDKIEKSLSVFLENAEIFAVYSGTEYFNGEVNNVIFTLLKKIEKDIEKQLLICGNIFPIQSLLFRQVSIRFDKKLNMMEDYKFWLEVLKNKKIYTIKESLSLVRVHDLNTSIDENLMKKKRLDVVREYLEKHDILEQDILVQLLLMMDEVKVKEDKENIYKQISFKNRMIYNIKTIKRKIFKFKHIYKIKLKLY